MKKYQILLLLFVISLLSCAEKKSLEVQFAERNCQCFIDSGLPELVAEKTGDSKDLGKVTTETVGKEGEILASIRNCMGAISKEIQEQDIQLDGAKLNEEMDKRCKDLKEQLNLLRQH